MANDISMPLASETLVDENRVATPSWYRIFTMFADAFNGATRSIASAEVDITTKAAKAQVSLPAAWTFKFPEDETVVLIQNAPTGFTITKSTCITEVGTSTVTLKKNGSAIGGSANNASTSENVATHASSNVFTAGDDLSVTFSSTSADCENLNLTLAIDITLD